MPGCVFAIVSATTEMYSSATTSVVSQLTQERQDHALFSRAIT